MTATSPVTLRELAAPEVLATVEDLDLVARWVVEGFMHGQHRSPYVGFSVDFASHREYLPGDDLRHLNWKLFARQDRLYVKQYDAETNVDLQLVVDSSGSMTVGDQRESKLRYAAMLAASLAHLAAQQRDAVGLTLFADRVLEHYTARGNLDHRLAVLSALARARPHPPAQTARTLHEVAELMPRRALVVLISDLYYDPEELLSAFDHFRHFGHDVVVFHVLSPLERRMPIDGAVKLVDAESGEVLETIAHEIRRNYTTAVDAWLHELNRGCVARGIDHRAFTTDEPLDLALADYCLKRYQLF
jgi:uncharacterized protein (DUF58 family)